MLQRATIKSLMLLVLFISTTRAFSNDLSELKSIEEVRAFPFHEMSEHRRNVSLERVNDLIVNAISKLNSRRAQEAKEDIYSDWWCYDDDVLFEIRLALELSARKNDAKSVANSRDRVFAISNREKKMLPNNNFKLKDTSIDSVSSYVDKMMQRDQYWDQVVVEKFEALKNELDNNVQDVKALRQVVAREKCTVYSQNAEKFEKLLRIIGWPDFEKYGQKLSSQLTILTLHFDYHLDIQRLGAQKIKELFLQGKVSGNSYAILHDRYSLNSRGYQKYGTQVICGPNGYIPDTLESPEQLKSIRHEAGLIPFDEYKKLIPGCGNEITFPIQPKKMSSEWNKY